MKSSNSPRGSHRYGGSSLSKAAILVLSITTMMNVAPASAIIIAAPIANAAVLKLALVANISPSMSRAELSRLVGLSVNNAEGKKIGVVEAVHINKDGTVRNVIAGIGGFLDMGDHDVALDWDKLEISGGARKTITVNASKAELKAMPKFAFSNAKDRGTVYGDPE